MEKIKKAINKFFFLIYVKIFYKPYNKKINSNEIAVIGRGESANYYFKKFKKSPKIIGLVNFTDRDLKNIDIKILDNKEIILFFNIEGNTLSIKYLLRLNIRGILRTSNEGYSKGRERFNNLNKFQKIYLNIFPKFPNHLNKFIYLGNSGLLSIVYMIDVFKPKKVLLFGFNFYQSNMIRNYLPQESVYNEELVELKIAGINLKKNFLKLCDSFKNIEFEHYDDTKIDEIPNLKFINIKEVDNKIASS